MLRACRVCGELGHDSTACRHETVSVPDYDAAGRALLEGTHSASARVAADCLLGRGVAPLNVLWQPRNGGGSLAMDAASVYVGSIKAATNEALLKAKGVTHVVNCMRR